ncbi:MAG: nitronate monooxygenase [Proteobacteria bacterium]|nr:nitronate monooxygenase [Pseudomonadota bacterium]
MMKTRITEMLGIKYPILQGGMAWVADYQLVAAVSNAGGLGILGATIFTPDVLREQIRKIRENTDKPFGVNFLARSPFIDPILEVIKEEKVKMVTYGVGNPEKIIRACKPHGIKCIPVIPQVRLAVQAEKDGADAIIISGMEAGGHVGKLTSMILIPQTVDRVKVPVIAAGGIADGRGMAAAFLLGAEGIQMGTRFICVEECPVPMVTKQFILKAQAEDTLVTGNITGMPVRCLRNQMSETMEKMEMEKKDPLEMGMFGSGKMYKAFVEGDPLDGSVMAGQIVGLLNDIPTCKELIERTMKEAEEVLAKTTLRFKQ